MYDDVPPGWKRAFGKIMLRMYEKVGFITVNENEEEFIMVCKL